jgi:transcriptional regulator with XRE-family HTH domain
VQLGLRIRKARTKLGLSQEALGHHVGRSEGWVFQVEKGDAEPGYCDLLNLAAVLQVNLGQLVEDEAPVGVQQAESRAAPPKAQRGLTAAPDPGMMEADPQTAGLSPSEWLEEMRRRAFLLAAATVTGAAAVGWWPRAGQGSSETPAAVTLRDALLGCRPLAGGSEAPNLDRLGREVGAMFQARQESKYSDLMRMAPGLLQRGLQAVSELDGDDRLAAMAILSEIYQAIGGAFRKVGDLSLAAIAADRAMVAAEEHGSALTIANSARLLSRVLGDSGHHDQAVKVCSVVADRVKAEELRRPTPSSLSVYGQLLLAGAGAAAQGGDRALTADYFETAQSVGNQVGTDSNHRFTAFGPTNITVHRVHAAVVLGNGESAVQQARTVDLTRLPVVERRAQHLLDVALGYNLVGKPEQAAVALLTAEQIAAEEVRYGPIARLLVEQLRHRSSELSWKISALADRMQPTPP